MVNAIAALSARLGDRVSVNASVRAQHCNTLSEVPGEPPDVVAFAETTDEVAAIVTICAQHGVPMIPYGAGTSLEGQVNAPRGGVSIDLSRMKNIVSVHAEDLDCTVEAGVTRLELNDFLRNDGLFFPIDPGAEASFGGMVSTRASGTNAVRYGTMMTNTLGLTVVAPDGTIIRTGGRARKSATGYDLTRLYVGAEGTLGIVTEITLRLHGLPERIDGGYCSFPDIASACNTVIATIQAGIPVARIELLDEVQVRACNIWSKLDLIEAPMLFVEFHGGPVSVDEQISQFQSISADFGGSDFVHSSRPEARTRLWKARHDCYWAASNLRPGARGIPTDICVPISRLAECLSETKSDIQAAGLMAPIVGHVGDGNFHALLLVDSCNAEERARAAEVLDRMVLRAQSMGGTFSGEHGVGQSNRKYMSGEHGADGLAMMRTIKRAIDPDNLMNPGKIFFE
jgi:D-lactate dehydrogenase (cytochrome)